MKKVLSVLLVLILALSLMLPVCASESETDEETGITSIPLFNCDTKPTGNNALSLDTEDKTEGEASLKFNVGAGQVNEMKLPEVVDGTDYDTLEFDLYVSDVRLFDLFGEVGKMDSNLEITSSGECDNQELAWTLDSIRFNNKGGELKAGWNHVILPLASAKEDEGVKDGKSGPFDISNINFLRFYMVGESENTGITVKIDNFRLSDWDAITKAERQEAAYREAAAKVVEKIEAIGEITAENFESVKEDVAAARRAYDRLGSGAKEYVAKAAVNKLTAAEAKIAEFEANPPEDEQPKDETNGGTTDEENNGSDEQPPVDEKKGCGASLAFGGVAMIVMALSLGVGALKKR